MSCFFFNILKLQREFSSEVDSAIAALRGLSVDGSCGNADLTQLFRVAAHEAKKSRAQNRIFRVVSKASIHSVTFIFICLYSYLLISTLRNFFHLSIASLLVIQLYLRVVVENGLEYFFSQLVLYGKHFVYFSLFSR